MMQLGHQNLDACAPVLLMKKGYIKLTNVRLLQVINIRSSLWCKQLKQYAGRVVSASKFSASYCGSCEPYMLNILVLRQ